MGIYATAHLSYGIVIDPLIDVDNDIYHPLWNADEDDWRDIPDNPYVEWDLPGHMGKAILRLKPTKRYLAWLDEPVEPNNLDVLLTDCVDADEYIKNNLGLDLSMRNDGRWWLAASYG